MAFVTPITLGLASSSRFLQTFPIASRPHLAIHHRSLSHKSRLHACVASNKALIFDCDGVIVESEELHRLAYNQCWQSEGLNFEWSVAFYEMLQNSIGGGREKMRWYFDKYGWPSHVLDKESFLDRLVDVKTRLYKQMIQEGKVEIREGVLRLMDEAYARGLKLAICSAANRQAVETVLQRLIGERLKMFDLIIAGDMVQKKKPHPMIYNLACEKLKVEPQNCVVIEDSAIGLQAGVKAGMRVVITYTSYTKNQDFSQAVAVYDGLGSSIGVDDLFPELASVTA